MDPMIEDQEAWIFGYHSLIWKAGFEYDRKIVGFIKGRRRAFHLGTLP
jgi:cation transport regulator ChaC